MEITLLEIGKKAIFLQKLQNLLKCINMSLTCVLCIDEDVVQVDNDEDIQLVGHKFVDITLEAGRYIEETKKHNLVLEMTVSSSKSCFLFITFLDFYLMIGTDEIQLGKLLCTSQSIKRFTDEWERIPILNGEVIKISVVNTKSKAPIGFSVE